MDVAAPTHLYSVVARTKRSWCRCAAGWYSSGGGGGCAGGSGQCFANIRTVCIKTVMRQSVAGVQTERALVYVLASLLDVAGEARIVARLETGWTDWRAPVSADRVYAALIYSASRESVDTFVDVCDKEIYIKMGCRRGKKMFLQQIAITDAEAGFYIEKVPAAANPNVIRDRRARLFDSVRSAVSIISALLRGRRIVR